MIIVIVLILKISIFIVVIIIFFINTKMVHPALTHTVNVVHIIFFVFLNILYGYVAIKVRKTKMDRTAKLILVLNYLVYLREFVSSVIDNVDGLVFSMFNITCYIILQLATIIILSEAERVKLI